MNNRARIIVAIIGAVALVTTAIISYQAAIKPVEKEIEATLTAEAQLPTSTIISTKTQLPTETQTLTPTETITPTITQTLPPTPLVAADTSNLVGWVPYFYSSNGDNTINSVSTNENVLELTYDVGKDGYVVITKSINPRVLSDTYGISFLYKGRGAPNTIEFKLLLSYPGDKDDTTYGYLWNRATDTNNKWIEMEVLYSDMWCWWPEENCKLHGDLLDIKMIDRLDFVVSNKQGDDEGSGWILLKDVFGIRP